jgi:hypothetical protein
MKHLLQGRIRTRAHLEAAGQGARQPPGLRHRTEIHKPHAVRGVWYSPPSCLDGQPGLADATRSYKGDQPVSTEQLLELGQLLTPPDQP